MEAQYEKQEERKGWKRKLMGAGKWRATREKKSVMARSGQTGGRGGVWRKSGVVWCGTFSGMARLGQGLSLSLSVY